MFDYQPIVASTCDQIAAPTRRPIPLQPRENESPHHILVEDPFGLRRAIVPVFLDNGQGVIVGAGTAFHIDNWGTLLTADHVIEDIRSTHPPIAFRPETEELRHFGPTDAHAYVLLGGVLAYGTARLPDGLVQLVTSMRTPIRQAAENPLRDLQGGSDAAVAADIAVMRIGTPAGKNAATLPIRMHRWHPQIGETVVAIGFPEIDVIQRKSRSDLHTLREGMFASYGRVIAAHPHGLSRTNPTPVVEVEADWASGMSGGPVLNEAGEVVGIVSRSLAPEPGSSVGVGWAACFMLMPGLTSWMPTVDPDNPCWRLGWAVVRNAPWSLGGFFESQAQAEAACATMGEGYGVAYGSNLIGTDNFTSRSTT